MKTLVCTEPGKFEYSAIDRPHPQPDRSVIRIRRIGICGTDLHAFEGTQPYFDYPRILGHELAGELAEADNAPGFEIGETVSFIPYLSCGYCIACRSGKPNCCVRLQVFGVHLDGGMVEYLSVPSFLLLHGEGLDLDELALVEPLAVSAHGIRQAGIVKDQFVLIVGAGPIGLGAMEFARIRGAKVIALDSNERRLQFCKHKLAVDYIVNPADAVGQLNEITNGDMPTVIVDATGNLQAINNAFHYMAHGGKYILIGLQKGDISFSHPEFHKREGSLMSSRNATRQDFEYVISKIKNGRIKPKDLITHRVHFDDVKKDFKSWLDPNNGVIKATVEL